MFDMEIERAAEAYGIDVPVVCAVIEQESKYDQYAHNPEPRYQYMWDVLRKKPFRALLPAEKTSMFPPQDFHSLGRSDPDQEWWNQKASWGLMQVMGAVAREQGFEGTYLTALVDPVINLEHGCMHLKNLMTWARSMATRDTPTPQILLSAFAAYNGGKSGNAPNTVPKRNQKYANEVLARVRYA